MRITGFQAENFKRLKAVEISPDDHTVVIAGRNAQGKSSILDGIWAALGGKAGAKELSRPIRDGEKRGSVVIELDDLRVERKWTPGGSTLTVGPKDGSAKFNTPQAILDKLIGALSFDPLAFAEAAPKDQRQQLLALTGLQEAVDAIETRRKHNYDSRTEVNREVKRLKAQLDGLAGLPPEAVEYIDLGATLTELGHAREREALLADHARITEGIAVLVQKIEELQADKAAIVEKGLSIPKTRTTETLQKLLETAEANNRNVDLRRRHEELGEEYQHAAGAAHDLTEAIEADEQAKLDLLAGAALPFEGLSFDEDGVLYNGIPLQQSSAAERLKVSVAMAMAANPEVRVICIKDASLLDSDSRRVLTEMAQERDYQIWYEVVGDGGPTGIVIEDGMVQA